MPNLHKMHRPRHPAAPVLNGKMKQGTNGHSVPLGANYLALQTRTDGVFQYVVSYSPPVE